MPSYEQEPAWFIGRIGAPLYPQPDGGAPLTEHAETIKAELVNRIDSSNGVYLGALDITVENAPLIESVDTNTVEISVNVMSLRKGVEAENISELTARVNAGDPDNMEAVSSVATNIYTGDEQSVVDKLDEWAGYNSDRTRQPLPDPGQYQIPPDPYHGDQPTGTAFQAKFGASALEILKQSGQGEVPAIMRLPGAKVFDPAHPYTPAESDTGG